MPLLAVVVVSAVILTVAYFTYGPVLARLLQLNATTETPAVELRDDVDYVPLEPNALLSQHFSAIAAAGPIVGPILAGVMFGWLPALIWILVGSILIGGVHDIAALVASIRHKARSIAEVVREHMSRRAFVLFLCFVWFALVYIIVAFTDITAASFVGRQTLENGDVVTGAGIASSSLMYLALPIIMGILLRYTKLSLGWATLIFIPLVGVAIWAGQKLPFDLDPIVKSFAPNADAGVTHKVWDVILLAYCCIASVVPMWLLLQPRGHLGGYFLYIALLGGALGLIMSGGQAEFPAYRGWTTPAGDTLFPVLFITIACGACSGFHALIASGTTSKQLRVETDAKLIGYGAMLLEAMVAVVSLCCVMRLAVDSPLFKTPQPNVIYAMGIGSFLETLGLDPQLGVAFALMAFTTFVYDTLDVCTRLGRYIIQELTGWYDAKGKWLGTILTGGAPVFFVMQTLIGPDGREVALWRVFWKLFGASNQLLAALTLLGVTVWLWKTRRAWWVWPVFGLPTVWMYSMSTWALCTMIGDYWKLVTAEGTVQTVTYVLFGITTLLVVLAVLMLIEAIRALLPQSPPTDDGRRTVTVPATA
ncbi:MAG: carbon starvation CstA family protein [Planctomycetaceae bacterium]|nr:carbon starvation CstA family protein [Planctomycetaceae bacterium]